MDHRRRQMNTDKKRKQRLRIAARHLCSSIRAIGWRALAVFIGVHLWFPLAGSAAGAAAPQKVVDQIVAQVNEDIITRSDLLWSLALDPKAPNPAEGVAADLLRQKLDVMIDQRLIAQEARRTPTSEITADDIAKRRQQLVKEFRPEPAFLERTGAVGLTDERINDLVRERILIERFIDFRFRSFVLVTEPEIQRYYEENLAPRYRERGQVVPSLDDRLPRKDPTNPTEKEVTVREAIEEIIRQEKINQEIDRFLNAARQRADIVILTDL